MPADTLHEAHGRSAAVGQAPSRPSSYSVISGILARLFAVACVLLALGAIFFVCLKPHSEDDFFWQARTGQIILHSRRIPHLDPFSWTAHGQPWSVHGWLTPVLFYLMASRLPVWSIVAYKAGLAALACGLALWRAWIRSGSWFLSTMIALLLGLTLAEWAGVRPEMLTLVLLASLLAGLDLYRKGRARYLPFLLPVVFVLWANLHLSAAIGLALILTWVLGEWLAQRGSTEGRQRLRPLVFGLAVAALAIGLNPEGFTLYAYPFHGPGHPVVMGQDSEWASPDVHLRSAQYFAIWLLGTPIAMAIAGRQRGWSAGDALLLSVMALAALRFARDTVPFAIATAPVFAGAIATGWRGFSPPEPRRAFLRRPALRRAGAAVLPFLLVLLLYRKIPRDGPVRLAPHKWLGYTLRLDALPRAGAAFLASGKCPGRLYNDYGWGGDLIYRLWPKRQVFVDGRTELYDKSGVLDDAVRIESAAPGYQDALDRRGVQVVLTHVNGKLAKALLEDSKWRLVLRGDVERIYVRVSPQ